MANISVLLVNDFISGCFLVSDTVNKVMQLSRDGISETFYGAAGGNLVFCSSHMEWIPQSKYVYGHETSKDDSRTQIQS